MVEKRKNNTNAEPQNARGELCPENEHEGNS